jgi:hypothetical protein
MNNILILTGYNDAMREVGDLCSANQRAYALRHGYAHETVREYQPGSHPSWQKMRLVLERLPARDAILWLDADTVVTDPLRPIQNDPLPGLHVSRDWTVPMPEDVVKHFSLGNFLATNHQPTFDILHAASKRTEWQNAELWEQQAIQEEYRNNPAIRHTVRIHQRRDFNPVALTEQTGGPETWQPGDWLCHMTHMSNGSRVAMFHEFDLAAMRSIVPNLPSCHETGYCADIRHIACLREILRAHPFRSALEIGVWQGASTAAFILAFDAGELANYTACDEGIQQEFMDVIGPHRYQWVTIRNERSVECLDRPDEHDIIFADGDHSEETGRDEAERIIRRQPLCVLAHDTRSPEAGHPECKGPPILREKLRENGYQITEDAKDRPGEQTKRGFMAATKCPDLHAKITRAFALTCY